VHEGEIVFKESAECDEEKVDDTVAESNERQIDNWNDNTPNGRLYRAGWRRSTHNVSKKKPK